MMNKAQERSLDRIKHAALNLYGYPEKHELKKWEVTEHLRRDGRGSWLFVIIEVGYKDDEGTMNAIVSRQRGTFSIGERGGITSTEVRNGKFGRRTKALKYPLIYGFTTFGN